MENNIPQWLKDEAAKELPFDGKNTFDDIKQKARRDGYITATLKRMEKEKEIAELLQEARLQIEYLHGKFKETGSGNSVISRIATYLSQLNKQT